MLEIDGRSLEWLTETISRDDTLASVTAPLFCEKLVLPNDWIQWRSMIDDHLIAGEAVVIRGFGRDPRLLAAFGQATGRMLHDPLGFGIVSTLAVQPFTLSVAETTAPIEFHTDFSSDAQPPDVVAIQVLEPDPRYPTFGRNQVASVSQVLDLLEDTYPGIRAYMAKLELPVGPFGNQNVGPILVDGEPPRLLWPDPVIDTQRLGEAHFFKGTALREMIQEAAKSVCEDVALDAGDLLLAHNRTALHRRGVCTVAHTKNGWRSRRICTMRWFQ